jgi:dTDP-4-dehydrorhamnose 3,5-epimerase
VVAAPDHVGVVELVPLGIDGAVRLESPVHGDPRGASREWFKLPDLVAGGIGWTVQQANLSTSRRNSVRGLHYSLAAAGQAKVVTCVDGLIEDVLVDVRVGSPTYGVVITVTLDALVGVSVHVPAGVAHGFCVTGETGTLCYLLSSPYAPAVELEIDPFDSELAIAWPLTGDAILSEKDQSAPSLATRRERGELPVWGA